MESTDHLRAFARRWLVVALCLAVAVVAGVAYTARSPKQYRTTVKFIVVDKGGSVSTQNAYAGNLLSQQLAGSFAQLVGTIDLARVVAGRDPAVGSAPAVQSRISGASVLGTNLFTASVTDTSPEGALDLADALTAVVPDYMAQVQSTRSPRNSPIVVKVAESPSLPSAPFSPRPARNVAVALVLGLLAAVTTVLALERADSSTRSSAQVATVTELPLLGELPMRRRAVREANSAAGAYPSKERVEVFRRLRARLVHGHPPTVPVSLAIVSPRPGDGRTSTACELGMALAAAGSSVLLVDADLRPTSSSGITGYFGVPNESGLFDVLAEDVDPANVVWSCHSLLNLLPRGSGRIQAHLDAIASSGGREPGLRLESYDVAAALKDLETQYDVVIIDTPPFLSSADGLVVASLANSTILVVQRGRTSLDEVRRAAEDLQSVGASVRGVLVTFASGRLPFHLGRPRPTRAAGP